MLVCGCGKKNVELLLVVVRGIVLVLLVGAGEFEVGNGK